MIVATVVVHAITGTVEGVRTCSHDYCRHAYIYIIFTHTHAIAATKQHSTVVTNMAAEKKVAPAFLHAAAFARVMNPDTCV